MLVCASRLFLAPRVATEILDRVNLAGLGIDEG